MPQRRPGSQQYLVQNPNVGRAVSVGRQPSAWAWHQKWGQDAGKQWPSGGGGTPDHPSVYGVDFWGGSGGLSVGSDPLSQQAGRTGGSNPNTRAGAQQYLSQSPDVRQAVNNPDNEAVTSAWDHYQEYGQDEGRGWPGNQGPQATDPTEVFRSAVQNGGRQQVSPTQEIVNGQPGGGDIGGLGGGAGRPSDVSGDPEDDLDTAIAQSAQRDAEMRVQQRMGGAGLGGAGLGSALGVTGGLLDQQSDQAMPIRRGPGLGSGPGARAGQLPTLGDRAGDTAPLPGGPPVPSDPTTEGSFYQGPSRENAAALPGGGLVGGPSGSPGGGFGRQQQRNQRRNQNPMDMRQNQRRQGLGGGSGRGSFF